MYLYLNLLAIIFNLSTDVGNQIYFLNHNLCINVYSSTNITWIFTLVDCHLQKMFNNTYTVENIDWIHSLWKLFWTCVTLDCIAVDLWWPTNSKGFPIRSSTLDKHSRQLWKYSSDLRGSLPHKWLQAFVLETVPSKRKMPRPRLL